MAYVERSYLTEQFENLLHDDNVMNPVIKVLDALEIIDTAPTADVEEVKHGEWKMEYNETRSTRGRLIRNKLFTCSNCNRRNGRITTKYCSNCGAKMDGGKTNEKD